MKKILKFFGVLVFLATPVSAQSNKDVQSIWKIGTRVFDLRADIEKMTYFEFIYSLTLGKSWIRSAVKSDPILGKFQLNIGLSRFGSSAKKKNKLRLEGAPFSVLPPLDLPQEGYEYFTYLNPKDRTDDWNIDSVFDRRFVVVPKYGPKNFSVKCVRKGTLLERDYRSCFLYVDYPPDPKISLEVRMLYAEAPFRFREIADRALEIVTCMDVTDAARSPNFIPAPLVPINGPYPSLIGCGDKLRS